MNEIIKIAEEKQKPVNIFKAGSREMNGNLL